MSARLEAEFERLARELLEDFRSAAAKSEALAIRDRFFGAIYRPTPFEGRGRGARVVFVDSGNTGSEYATDAFQLVFVRLGGLVRDGGRLEPLGPMLGAPESELYAVYGALTGDGAKLEFAPLEESISLGGPEQLARTSAWVSERLSVWARRRLSADPLAWGDASKTLKRVVDYAVGLLELSLCLRALSSIDADICALDGTLIRWYGAGRWGRALGFDGLSVAASLAGLPEGRAAGLLARVVGVAKTTKFTTLARARKVLGGLAGGYARLTPESVGEASKVLREVAARSGRAAVKLLRIVSSPVFDLHGVYAVRYPATPDGASVYVLGIYLGDQVIDEQSLEPKPGVAEEASERMSGYAEALFSSVTRAVGYPPHGLMEVDAMVRLKKALAREKLAGRVAAYVAKASGDPSHPIAEVFKPGYIKRLGYAGGRP